MPYLLTIFILADMAHVLSPMVRSWLHPKFRGVMLRDWRRWILSPVLSFSVGMALPWGPAIALFGIVNFHHFAMQNFGLLQLGRPNRRVNLPVAMVGTAAAIWVSPLSTGIHHAITDLWLSMRAAGRQRWVFLVLVFALAPMAFLWDRAPWLWPELTHVVFQPRTAVVSMLIQMRLSLGLMHSSLSAGIWQFSDPLVRATIGKELCA